MTVQPDPPESPYTASFVMVTHADTGQTSLVPNMPGVLDNMAARGWAPSDPSADVVPTPADPGDGAEFVTLFHPELKKVHDFPNHPDAIQGAREAGWTDVPTDEASDPDGESSPTGEEDGTANDPEPKPAKKTATSKKTAASPEEKE